MPSAELRTYLGPPDRPLYGALHLPEGRAARGAVLICPPLAKEQYDALRGLRLLADTLAGAGFAVLRFDYYGTGDSALADGRADAVELWLESIRSAASYLRGLGLGEPGVVGLRAGALLACAAGLEPPALALWDPVLRGRALVREQTALAGLAGLPVGAEAAGGRHTWVGLTVGDEALARLSALRAEPAAPRLLVASRPGARADVAGADRLEVHGMPEFLQAGDHVVRLPDCAIADVTAWVAAAMPDREAVTVEPRLRDEARLPQPDGTVLVERIESIGGAAAIRTLPLPDGAPRASVLLCATANDPRHGPNREWVHLARRVAAAGGHALRFDRRGAGESGPVRPGDVVSLFPPSGIDDAVGAGRTLGEPGGLLVCGLCSGSWYAAQVGALLTPAAVVLVNSVMYSWRVKPGIADGAVDLGVPRTDRSFQRSPRGRVKALLRRRLPYPAWELLGRRGVTQVPRVLLRPLVRTGVDVTLVLAPPDAVWFDDQRGPEGWARLAADAARAPAPVTPPRLVRVPRGDHPGYHPAVREAVATAILLWCEQR